MLNIISSTTIGSSSIVSFGDWVALNPKHSGYFDDRELSGLFLHQFDMENGSNRGQVTSEMNISRIEKAVALGRLVILPDKDAPIPRVSVNRISNRTRSMLSEQQESEIDPKRILYSVNEKELLNHILPDVKDKSILEYLLQLETNGDNRMSQPRARVVDYLTDKIKEYAKQVAIIDVNKNKVVRDEVVENEGEEDIEFTKLQETKAEPTTKKTTRRRGRR